MKSDGTGRISGSMGLIRVVVKRRLPKILQYNLRRDRFEFFCDYQDRFIAKAAGFFWLPEIKAWCTADWRRAVKLMRYADAESKAQLQAKAGHSLNALPPATTRAAQS